MLIFDTTGDSVSLLSKAICQFQFAESRLWAFFRESTCKQCVFSSGNANQKNGYSTNGDAIGVAAMESCAISIGMILAYTNLKGGCGKSTLAAHSYGYLHREGISRWLVDSDPQASSSDWLTGNDPDSNCYHLTDPTDVAEASQERARDNEVVVIDAAGTLDDVSKSVLMIADIVMIPCRPSRMDYNATVEVLRLVNQANSIRKFPLKPMVIPMMVRSNDSMSWQLHAELGDLDVAVAPHVSYRVSFAKAAGDENFVWDQKDSQATAEIELLMQHIRDHA